ncbi:MAG: SMR family transporter, partial [Anaerovoracaceae bacterium]
MPYVLLGTAIVLEIIATTLLKSSEGFTKLLPAVFCIL